MGIDPSIQRGGGWREGCGGIRINRGRDAGRIEGEVFPYAHPGAIGRHDPKMVDAVRMDIRDFLGHESVIATGDGG